MYHCLLVVEGRCRCSSGTRMGSGILIAGSVACRSCCKPVVPVPPLGLHTRGCISRSALLLVPQAAGANQGYGVVRVSCTMNKKGGQLFHSMVVYMYQCISYPKPVPPHVVFPPAQHPPSHRHLSPLPSRHHHPSPRLLPPSPYSPFHPPPLPPLPPLPLRPH